MGSSRVTRTLVITLILNISVAVLKGVTGFLSGSVGMIADAFHSLFDSVSNIIGLISIHFASLPPDPQHPYGHGKVETVGAMAVGVILLFTSVEVVREALSRVQEGGVLEITPVMVGVMVVTIIINICVNRYERKVGMEENSEFLLADAKHTLSDVFVSFSVLAGFALVIAGFRYGDAAVAVLIGLLIAKMGIEVLRDAVLVLIDTSDVRVEKEVAGVVLTVPGVLGYHNFRCRGKPNELFCDLHIVVDPQITVLEADRIGSAVRDGIKEGVRGMVDVVVHIDPAHGTKTKHNTASGETSEYEAK
ncbi:MAG TPA: cation transporter [Methanoculleus sp.]|nr:cation transporter [Methanoculleus sp.]